MRQTITPYLYYEDAEAAVEFLTEGFGFHEIHRALGTAGGMHIELKGGTNEALLYVGCPGAGFRGPAAAGRTSLLYVLVDDVDRHYEQAQRAGASILEPVNDLPYGDRRYRCTDPQGHEWTFATPIVDRAEAPKAEPARV